MLADVNLAARTIVGAVAGNIVGPSQPTTDDSRGTTYTSTHGDSLHGAIALAGTTFDTSIAVGDDRQARLQCEHRLWAYHQTQTAAVTLFGIEFECHDVIEIMQTSQNRSYRKSPVTQAVTPSTAPPI